MLGQAALPGNGARKKIMEDCKTAPRYDLKNGREGGKNKSKKGQKKRRFRGEKVAKGESKGNGRTSSSSGRRKMQRGCAKKIGIKIPVTS